MLRKLSMTRFFLLAFVLILFAFRPNIVIATATPSSTTAETCDVPPRSLADVTRLLASRGMATPAATTGGMTVPTGTPTDPAEAAAIEQTVRRWLACENAGQPLSAWALFSDGYLYRLLSRLNVADSEALAVAAAPNTGNASGGAELVSIRGQRELPDGRLGATVTIAYPSVPMPKTFFFAFTLVDGHLLIDGILGEISFSVP
jgi:hypothetical protein